MTDEQSFAGDPKSPLRHRAFFQVGGQLREGTNESEAMLAGLIVLRLLDKWPEPVPTTEEIDEARITDFEPVQSKVASLDDTPVKRTLTALVDAIGHFSKGDHDYRLAPLISYAQFLEEEKHWEPAADVYETTIEIIRKTGRDDELLLVCYAHAAQCLRAAGQRERAHELLSTGIEVATNLTAEGTEPHKHYWLRRMQIDIATLAGEMLEAGQDWESAAAIYLGAIDVIKSQQKEAIGELPRWFDRAAFCFRQLGQFDQADNILNDGIEVAVSRGDVHWSLHLRTSSAIVERYKGDLPEAEFELDSIIEDAKEANDRDVLAVAFHERGVVAYDRNQFAVAAEFYHDAARTYADPKKVRRAVRDIALALSDLGYLDHARKAYLTVWHAKDSEPDSVAIAGVNLIRLAWLANDRSTFDELRVKVESLRMAGRLRAHYHLFVGQGLRRFGEPGAAKKQFERAIALAEQYRVYKLLWEAEAMLASTDDRPIPWKQPEEASTLAPLLHEIDAQQGVFAGAMAN